MNGLNFTSFSFRREEQQVDWFPWELIQVIVCIVNIWK